MQKSSSDEEVTRAATAATKGQQHKENKDTQFWEKHRKRARDAEAALLEADGEPPARTCAPQSNRQAPNSVMVLRARGHSQHHTTVLPTRCSQARPGSCSSPRWQVERSPR